MWTHLSDGPRPTDSTGRWRPIYPTAHRRPIYPTAHKRPMDPTACSGVKVTTVCIWPMVVAATSKPRKRKTREINKPETNARLLRQLHRLHPLSIKDRHQCKYREHPTLYKNGLLFSSAGGCTLRINFVLHQNKLQLYNKRKVGIKLSSLADKCTTRSSEAQFI